MIAKKVGSVAWALCAAALFLIPSAARADMDFGIRGGFYDDADAALLGGELLWDVTQRWFFNPNLEYVFVDDGDLATINLDVHYDFEIGSPFYVWAGGGPAVILKDIDPPPSCRGCEDDDEIDLGLNLLGGIGFGKGQAIRPYLQGKVILADDTEAVLAVGIRFY